MMAYSDLLIIISLLQIVIMVYSYWGYTREHHSNKPVESVTDIIKRQRERDA